MNWQQAGNETQMSVSLVNRTFTREYWTRGKQFFDIYIVILLLCYTTFMELSLVVDDDVWKPDCKSSICPREGAFAEMVESRSRPPLWKITSGRKLEEVYLALRRRFYGNSEGNGLLLRRGIWGGSWHIAK